MVGTCPHCKRPWYTAGESLPRVCRGCGGDLSSEDISEPVVSAAPPTPPIATAEAIVEQVAARQVRLAAARESADISRVMMVIGGLALLADAAWCVETWNFKRSAVRMTGYVVSSSEYRSRRSSGTIATVEYYGGNGRQTLTVWSPKSQSVPLLVSKSDPSDARTPDGLWTNKIGIGVLAAVVFAGGVFLRPGRGEVEAALA